MDDSDDDDKKPTHTSADKSKVSTAKESSKSKKRRVLYSSDEDEPKPKSKSKDTLASKASKLKAVDVSNAFGSAPVKRIEKEKKPKANVSIDVFDADTDDMDFMQVDDDVVSSKPIKRESSQNEHKKKKDDKHSPKKENGILKSKNDKTPEKIKTEKKTPKKSDAEKKSPTKEEKRSPSDDSKKSKDTDHHSAKKKSQKNTPASSKKPKKPDDEEEELDRSVYDPDEEKQEKKRAAAILYHQRQKRAGPSNPGSKEIPKGKANCLNGLTFVLTGEFESMERDEAKAVIIELGGRVTSAISGKTNYIVAGEEAGPAKLAKAEDMNISVLSEDDLLDLIRVKSDMKPVNSKSKVAETAASPKKDKKASPSDKKSSKKSSTHDERAHSSGKSETVTKIKTEKVEVMDVDAAGKFQSK